MAAARLKAIVKQVQQQGEAADARYGATPDGMVWDGRLHNAAGSTGDALGVLGSVVIVHNDMGYDFYLGREWRVDDAALAQEVRRLVSEINR